MHNFDYCQWRIPTGEVKAAECAKRMFLNTHDQ